MSVYCVSLLELHTHHIKNNIEVGKRSKMCRIFRIANYFLYFFSIFRTVITIDLFCCCTTLFCYPKNQLLLTELLLFFFLIFTFLYFLNQVTPICTLCDGTFLCQDNNGYYLVTCARIMTEITMVRKIECTFQYTSIYNFLK